MTVTVNGTEFDSHPVACPECGDELDAQVVLLERACPECGVGYRVFFDDAPDPEAAAIEYPFDGPAEVRTE
jgi:ribosomal protein S27AE